jgi:uncharacterized protein (UPF0276 family)
VIQSKHPVKIGVEYGYSRQTRGHHIIMRFAVNFSKQGAQLWQEGFIQVDCFKCPAWSELINELRFDYPLYVHFPLRVGIGIGSAVDTEKNAIPDWHAFEILTAQTNTPFFNVHLAPIPEDHPEIPVDVLGISYSDQLTDYMVQDIKPIVDRYGVESVIAENIYSAWGEHPIAAILPEVVYDVITESGCGLLLDISHARQAARELGMDPKTYINKLPLHRLRELHVSGIQPFTEYWIGMLRDADITNIDFAKFVNQPIDHLPMVQQDWLFFQWALDQIIEGIWQEPEIIAFEYSGIGKGFFQATTNSEVLKSQVPRLYDLVHAINKLPKHIVLEKEDIHGTNQ